MRYKKSNIKLNKANKNLKKQNKIKTILVKKLKKQTKILEKESSVDYLTKLYNRKYTEFRLSEEFKRAIRYNSSLTFIMCDIDYFKKINDTFSHKIGDEVLKTIAHIFKRTCRSIDIIGRFGGDEFMFILPNTTISEGLVVCNRINNAINNYDWKKIHPELKVTVSFGLADTKVGVSDSGQLFEIADKKLYEAKNNGRGLIKI
jgi:diguanylate cyclase (GGDEF)-like protein